MFIQVFYKGNEMTQTITFSAFGKNDIRGIYGEDVTEELFYYTGKGFVKYIQEKTGLIPADIWITISKDARLHSESLAKALSKGIVHMGANVISLDIVPTPLGYYSEFASYPEHISNNVVISGALIVTASHNPSEYNGLKLTFNKSSLDEEAIKVVKNYTMEQMSNDITAVKHGESRLFNIIPQYTESLVSKFLGIGHGIKVVVDSANATGGVVAPKLYRALGCEVVELYSMPDGRFPHHHPNPSDEKTLNDIKKAVIANIAKDADIPRGSFYQYFTSLEDLYIYLIDYLYGINNKKFISYLEENGNNIYDAIKYKFAVEIDKLTKESNRQFKLNTLSILFSDGDTYSKEMVQYVLERQAQFDINYIPVEMQKNKNIDKFVDMVKAISDMFIKKYLTNEVNESQVKTQYNNYIDFLKLNFGSL